MQRNVYRQDFAAGDWALGQGLNEVVVCAPILPSDFDANLIGPDGKPVDGAIFSAQQDDAPAALIYKVISLSPQAQAKLPDLAPGYTVIVRNLSGYTTSSRVKFFLFEPKDILWAWAPGRL